MCLNESSVRRGLADNGTYSLNRSSNRGLLDSRSSNLLNGSDGGSSGLGSGRHGELYELCEKS